MDYKQHKLFRRLDGVVAIYVCLERIGDSQFAVHQMELVPAGQLKSSTAEIDATFLELFSEESPDIRCDWFPSLRSAIDAHDKEFEN
jgi:hypothetical protein